MVCGVWWCLTHVLILARQRVHRIRVAERWGSDSRRPHHPGNLVQELDNTHNNCNCHTSRRSPALSRPYWSKPTNDAWHRGPDNISGNTPRSAASRAKPAVQLVQTDHDACIASLPTNDGNTAKTASSQAKPTEYMPRVNDERGQACRVEKKGNAA